MAKARETILKQVEDLLKTEGWTTQDEAETAMLKARELIGKYKITDDELAAKRFKTEVTFLHLPNLVPSPWKTMLAGVVCGNFRCELLKMNVKTTHKYTGKPAVIEHYYFVGHETDALIAARVYLFAIRTAEHELLSYLLQNQDQLGTSRPEREKAGANWCEGFAMGVNDKFLAQTQKRNSGTAVMVVTPDDVKDAVEKVKNAESSYRTEVPPGEITQHHYLGYFTGIRTTDGAQELPVATEAEHG